MLKVENVPYKDKGNIFFWGFDLPYKVWISWAPGILV